MPRLGVLGRLRKLKRLPPHQRRCGLTVGSRHPRATADHSTRTRSKKFSSQGRQLAIRGVSSASPEKNRAFERIARRICRLQAWSGNSIRVASPSTIPAVRVADAEAHHHPGRHARVSCTRRFAGGRSRPQWATRWCRKVVKPRTADQRGHTPRVRRNDPRLSRNKGFPSNEKISGASKIF